MNSLIIMAKNFTENDRDKNCYKFLSKHSKYFGTSSETFYGNTGPKMFDGEFLQFVAYYCKCLS